MLLVSAHLPGDFQPPPFLLQVVLTRRRLQFCSDGGRVLLVPGDTLFCLRYQRRPTNLELIPFSRMIGVCSVSSAAIVSSRAQDERIAEVAYGRFGQAAETARLTGHVREGRRSINDLRCAVPRHADCIDDASMGNAPMPPTLESIAASLTELKKSMDAQFKRVDERFDQAEKDRVTLKSQLEIKVEAVEAEVHLVYDEVLGTRSEVRAIGSEHATFAQLYDNHEVRISALEAKNPAKR